MEYLVLVPVVRQSFIIDLFLLIPLRLALSFEEFMMVDFTL